MDTQNEIEILLVEDNLSDAELTIRALSGTNIVNKVTHVKDGAEALEFIFATGPYSERDIRQVPKVILLDMNMPKVNGLEVLRRIRSDSRTASILVVMLTISSGERDIIESYKLGVNSYIVKPFEFNKFMEAIGEIRLCWVLLNEPPKIGRDS